MNAMEEQQKAIKSRT